MVTEEAIREAGESFRQAIYSAQYNPEWDIVMFTTPWGMFAVPKNLIQEFKDVKKDILNKIYVSQTGVHIDEANIDINSAGLLSDLFKEIQAALTKSF